MCSECEVNNDCTDPQVCTYNFGDPYARCAGTTPAGGACSSNAECESGICDGVCLGALGDQCADGTECGSGYCYDTGYGGFLMCSECEIDDNCSAGETCNWTFTDPYATCG